MVMMAVVVPVMHVLLHVVLKLTMFAVPKVAGWSAQNPLLQKIGNIKHMPTGNLPVLSSKERKHVSALMPCCRQDVVKSRQRSCNLQKNILHKNAQHIGSTWLRLSACLASCMG